MLHTFLIEKYYRRKTANDAFNNLETVLSETKSSSIIQIRHKKSPKFQRKSNEMNHETRFLTFENSTYQLIIQRLRCSTGDKQLKDQRSTRSRSKINSPTQADFALSFSRQVSRLEE